MVHEYFHKVMNIFIKFSSFTMLRKKKINMEKTISKEYPSFLPLKTTENNMENENILFPIQKPRKIQP